MPYLGCVFSFWMFWFSRSLGIKGQRNGPKYVVCFLSQEPCIMRSCFLVHTCKIKIYPGIFLFHFFENFDIWVVVGGGGRREGKWSKKWPKMACCAVRTYLSLSKHYLLSIASILLYFKIEKPILCKKLQLPIWMDKPTPGQGNCFFPSCNVAIRKIRNCNSYFLFRSETHTCVWLCDGTFNNWVCKTLKSSLMKLL